LNQPLKKYFLIGLCALFVACNGTKRLPPGQSLYTGAKVAVEGEGKFSRRKIKSEASNAFAPRTNKKFLGLRIKLMIHNSVKDTTGSKFKKWLKYKVGQPPVLLTDANPEQVSKVIDATLFNMGIFNEVTRYEIKRKKNAASILYTVHVHTPYSISDYSFLQGNDSLSLMIHESMTDALVIRGNDYNLSVLKAERTRISEYLKDRGYYYFKPDYLVFKGDSSVTAKTIRLVLAVKPDIPDIATRKYYIRNIYFETDFSLTDTTGNRDTTLYDDIYFIEKEMIIRHRVIKRSVFIRKGDPYSRLNHNLSLSRIMSMGNYKYVSVRFTEADTTPGNYLDAYFYSTPSLKRTIRLETDMVSKSNNFFGPSQIINYKNRNTFNGAELLEFKLKGSFETQISGDYKGLFSYEIGPELSLYIPRFIVPFRIPASKSPFIPRTRISVSYDYSHRVEYYTLKSLQLTFGYEWKGSIKTLHRLNPVSINYYAVSDKTESFQEMLDEDPTLARSFEDQFIAGMDYSFTYNEQLYTLKRIQFYVNPTAELSGNVISLGKRVFANEKPEPGKPPLLLAGNPYAQFARASVDFRTYFRLTKKTTLVARFLGGIGIAYGNSITLPYVKQFFSGGPSDIRAFRYNSLGPGTYIAPDSVDNFYGQGGDYKLEANLEYRFPIIAILKGALFIDAGNTWLRKPNEEIQAEAISKDFYKEIALGAGYGIRLDVTFFVLRLDLAMPLRKPWLPENERWVVNDIQLGSPSWRKENMILNLAIGYPF